MFRTVPVRGASTHVPTHSPHMHPSHLMSRSMSRTHPALPPRTSHATGVRAPAAALGCEWGWFGPAKQQTDHRPKAMTGRYKPIYVALDTTFGSQGLVLLRTTGVDNSPQLKAFYEICVNAGLYEGQQGLKMLHREARQGYRVLLLVIDGDVRAGALFSLAKQADDPGTMLLDILMLAVAEEYRYTDGTRHRPDIGTALFWSSRSKIFYGSRQAGSTQRTCWRG